MDNKQNKSYNKYINIFLLLIIIFFSFILMKKIYFNEFYYKVPKIVGLEVKEAKNIVKKANLNIRNMGEIFSDLPYGIVAQQEPVESKVVKKGRNIKIWISKGNPVIFLENLIGKSYVEATSIIERDGLKVDNIIEISSSYPINTVIATHPKSGEPLEKNEKISLIISKGGN